MTGRERIEALIKGNEPDRIIYSPNIWQWFYHHKFHNSLPDDLKNCENLIDAHKKLGADCFSRNLASDQQRQWYGGFTKTRYEGIDVECIEKGYSRKIIYHTSKGDLHEEFLYDCQNSTLVQKKFLLDDPQKQLPEFKELVMARNLDFDKAAWTKAENAIGDLGMNIFGDIHNPLKLFHFACNPTNTIYLLADVPDLLMEIMEIHTAKCLETVQQAIDGGVKVIMNMDNLDTMFYPPSYFESYCAGYFKKLSHLCHANGALLTSHACGHIKQLLPLCVKAGLDGLEGITPPPLGDVELYDAKKITGGNFICNGGITASLQEKITSKTDVYDFTRSIFEKFDDKRQFVYSMSCNTSIRTTYDCLRWFNDATKDLSKEIFG